MSCECHVRFLACLGKMLFLERAEPRHAIIGVEQILRIF